jgi:aromatase
MSERHTDAPAACCASHSIVCNVPAEDLYRLIRSSRRWPAVLGPCRSVVVLEEGADFEHIQVTADVNGVEMTWRSRRGFLPGVSGIDAEIVEPMPLVAAMAVHWRVIALNGQQSVLLLEHEYSLSDVVAGQVDGVATLADAERFIAGGIDANSRTELANFKSAAERAVSSTPRREFHARHSVVCAAPAEAAYALVRDTSSWPVIFAACVGTSVVESRPSSELVRIEAEQDGHRVSWTTQRGYSDAMRRIDYHLPVPMPFLESMAGQWRVVPLGAERCLLSVDRRWCMLADVTGIREGVSTVAEAAAVVANMVDDNARAEMAAIRALVEGCGGVPLSVVDRFPVPNDPGELYRLLADVALWPAVLPHCESLRVLYDDAVHQEFTMHVTTPGGIETFRSIRHCDAETLTITYFQPEPPPMLGRHHGSWEVRGLGAGSEVVARHTVLLDRPACARELGTADLREQEGRVRERLRANSRLTLEALAGWLDTHQGGRPAAAGVVERD